MSTKISDILGAIGRLNSMIKHRGVAVRLGRRNNYKALDLYYIQAEGGEMIDTLRSGFTSGQALDYINAMIKGITIYTWGEK